MSKYFKVDSSIRSSVYDALRNGPDSISNQLYCRMDIFLDQEDWPGINHVSYGERPGYVSYVKQDYFEEEPSGKVQQMKVGKLLRMFKLSRPLADKEVETAVNAVKSRMIADTEGSFEIVSGEDIRHFYYSENYEDDPCVPLTHSCMKYRGCKNLLDIYAKNEVSMLVFLNAERKLRGRALIWHNVKTTKERQITFLDRIYASDALTPAFKRFAQEHGWYYKKDQSYDSRMNVMSPSNKYIKSVSMKLTVGLNTDFDQFPYLDTFRFGGDGFITNWEDESDPHRYEYSFTQGVRARSDNPYVIPKGRVNEYELEECYFSRWGGYIVHTDDAIFSDVVDSYIHDDDVVRVGGRVYPKDYPNLEKVKADYKAEQAKRLAELAQRKQEAASEGEAYQVVSEWLRSDWSSGTITGTMHLRRPAMDIEYFTFDTLSDIIEDEE
jgi:hypothetical protein